VFNKKLAEDIIKGRATFFVQGEGRSDKSCHDFLLHETLGGAHHVHIFFLRRIKKIFILRRMENSNPQRLIFERSIRIKETIASRTDKRSRQNSKETKKNTE